MKTIRMYTLFMALILWSQGANAQFFKKLKKAVTGEEKAMRAQKLSGLDQKFENWDMGEAQIIAISVFADDFEKHRQNIGTIEADGSFDFQMPDNLKTWVPVSVYGKDCKNAEEAVVENSEVKIAWNRLFVFQNGKHIGELMPANPVRAAYNLNNGGINNGNLGKYYLWVFADGDASATIDCKKEIEMTDGKDTTYKNMPVEDKFDLNYKKGWNIVEVNNLDNIWVGLTKHYQERTWKVVRELPKDVTWVFRPRMEEN